MSTCPIQAVAFIAIPTAYAEDRPEIRCCQMFMRGVGRDP